MVLLPDFVSETVEEVESFPCVVDFELRIFDKPLSRLSIFFSSSAHYDGKSLTVRIFCENFKRENFVPKENKIKLEKLQGKKRELETENWKTKPKKRKMQLLNTQPAIIQDTG